MRTFINKASHNKISDILHKYLNKTFNRFILYEPMNSTKKTHAHLVHSIVGHFAHCLSLFWLKCIGKLKACEQAHTKYSVYQPVGFSRRANFQLKRLADCHNLCRKGAAIFFYTKTQKTTFDLSHPTNYLVSSWYMPYLI